MIEPFIVPKEPRRGWKIVLPGLRQNEHSTALEKLIEDSSEVIAANWLLLGMYRPGWRMVFKDSQRRLLRRWASIITI